MKTKSLIGLLAGAVLSALLYFGNVIGGEIFLSVLVVIGVAAYMVVDSILFEKGRDSTLLVKAGISLLAAACLSYIGYAMAKYEFELYTKGIQTVAVVSHYEKTMTSGRKGRVRYHHTHTITYVGHTTKLDLPEQYPVGAQLDVRYLPSNPKFARVMEPKTTVSAMLDWGNGFALLLIGFLVFLGGAYLKEFLSPTP